MQVENLIPHVHNWTAKRSGPCQTVVGKDATTPRTFTGVYRIEKKSAAGYATAYGKDGEAVCTLD